MLIYPSRLFACLYLLLALAACSSTEQRQLPSQPTSEVDFSGSWELDYSQSDNIQAQLSALVREMRRRAERQSRGSNQPGASASMGGSGASVIALAQMADYVTQSQLLEISQDEEDILVKREGSFALGCDFLRNSLLNDSSPLGSEACGWDGHQLLFRVYLPEDLTIQHRLTLGPSGERLNIATTVVSSQARYPFTVNRVYNRFDPTLDGITCQQTLSKGRVCTTESP